jgi:hypothetical protein
MALTRQNAEAILFRRLGPAMSRADMDVTREGQNPYLGDIFTWSLLEMGYDAPSDLVDPSDTDLAQVEDTNLSQFLDLSEWRLCMTVIGNLDDTDEKLGPSGQWLSQFAKQMRQHLVDLESRLMANYGWGSSTLDVGTLRIITVQEQPVD